MTCSSLLLLVGVLCLAQLCHANEIHISPQDAPTLGSIVDQALDGDVLVFADGHYPISDRYGIWIKKNLTITAQTPGRVVIDGQGKCRGFQVTSDEVHLIGLNITNCGYCDNHGICTPGAGVRVAHKGEIHHKYVATVKDCNIYGNKGEDGGGMEFQSHGGTLEVVIVRTNIFDNFGNGMGGGLHLFGGGGDEQGVVTATIVDSSIIGNTVNSPTSFGGGIYLNPPANLNMYRSTVHANTASITGGGVAVYKRSYYQAVIKIDDKSSVYQNQPNDCYGFSSSRCGEHATSTGSL